MIFNNTFQLLAIHVLLKNNKYRMPNIKCKGLSDSYTELDYHYTVATYSCVHMSELGRDGEMEHEQTSKR